MISVVIPTYDGRRWLDGCLGALSRQTCRDFETILVDNGSRDGSAEHVEATFPWVRVVRNASNLGFAGGTNAGIRVARGAFILTLNNDTLVDEAFVERLLEPMSDRRVGMCASKMLFPDGTLNSTGICLSRSGAAWDRGMSEPDTGQFEQKDEVFGPCAGAALYRKEMLDEIGLFDEDFFLYVEDTDLAFRARLAGWQCVYVPEAKVCHMHAGTAGAESDLSVYYGNRNSVWYAVKNFPMRLLVTSLPFIAARHLAVIPYYALKGQGRVILRAEFDALKGIPRMLTKRRAVARRAPATEVARFVRTWAAVKRRS